MYLVGLPPVFVPLGSLSVVSATDGAGLGTTSMPIPAHQNGDLLIYIARFFTSSGTPADLTPAGWTKLATVITASNVRWSVFAKLADGTNEDSIPFLNSGTGASNTRMLYIVRGNVPIQAYTASDIVWGTVTASNPAAQVIPTASGAYPQVAVAVWAEDGGGAVSPRTSTPAMTAEVSAAAYLYSGIKLLNDGDTPTNVTVDMDDEGTNNFLASLRLLLT